MPERDVEPLFDSVEHLIRWKAEAMMVLDEWERVWEAAGRPGALGESKARAMLRWVRDRA